MPRHDFRGQTDETQDSRCASRSWGWMFPTDCLLRHASLSFTLSLCACVSLVQDDGALAADGPDGGKRRAKNDMARVARAGERNLSSKSALQQKEESFLLAEEGV